MMLTPNTVRPTESETTEARGLAAEVQNFYVLLGACCLRADAMDLERLRSLFPGVVQSVCRWPWPDLESEGDREPVVLGKKETVLIVSDAYRKLRGWPLADGKEGASG